MFNKSPYCHPGRRAGVHLNLMFKKNIKIILLIATIAAAWALGLEAATPVEKTTGTAEFTGNITVKAFDRASGTFYVGIGAGEAAHSIAKATRGALAFEEIAQGDAQDTVTSPNIALINNGGGAATHLAFKGGGGTATDLKVMQLNVPLYPLLTASTGAHGTANAIDMADGNAADAFTSVAGGKNYVFLRVNPGGGEGVQHSGILAFKVDGATPLVRIETAAGAAARLDDRQGAVAGDGNFLRNGSDSASLATPPAVKDMYWDEALGTLFIGGFVTSINAADFNMGITKVKLTDAPNLVISDVLPDAVNATANNATTIFASNSTGGMQHPCILKIRTMHTSTGRIYLIVNGGIGAVAAVGNQFYCLQYDPLALPIALAPTEKQGCVVQNNAAKVALVGNFLGTGGGSPLDGGNVGSLIIGGAVAPWEAANACSDIEVVGDTVYVSNATARGANNDPGVWSSRALFDNNGVIIGWTPWERVLASEATGANIADLTSFFAVDAQGGVLWRVCNAPGANAPNVVKRTTWTKAAAAAAGPGLAARLNNDLADGCTAVLDLPKGTPGIGAVANATNSIALFGGKEKVVFAQTKSLAVNAVTIDFSVAGKYLTTTLPAGAGYVRALGFTRLQVAFIGAYNATNNFFFAGTDNGLYAFADAVGLGWNAVAGYGLVNAAPFNTYTWQPMAATGVNAIKGAVTAIEANGTNIFVVEQDEDISGMIVSKLHRFEIGGSISNMVVNRAANHVIIAQSGKFGIPENAIFTGFALVSDTGAQADAYGLLSTNAGIFGSAAKLVALDPAANPWEPIEATKAFTMINSVKRVPTGVPDVDGKAQGVLTSYFADASNRYFQNNKASILGINWADVWNTSQLKDYVNNANATSLVDRTAAFWTDGGRRIFAPIGADGTVTKPLTSLPFNTAEWNMTEPYDIVANNPALKGIKRIHWIENISGLGILMAGTDQGVVTLE